MKIFGAKRGFTLIELMIVVAIIGILAAVAIPKFAQMMEKAKEGATKGNVGSIKSAVGIYYGDNQGSYPQGNLTDVLFQNYLATIPPVKLTHPASMFGSGGYQLAGSVATAASVATASGETFNTNTDGWLYNSQTGNVFVNNDQTDSQKIAGYTYTLYGY